MFKIYQLKPYLIFLKGMEIKTTLISPIYKVKD